MSEALKKIRRIEAVISASEGVIKETKCDRAREYTLIAKETAYDHIKGILEDVGYNPWQE